LTMTHAGSVNRHTSDTAAWRSSRLLYDSSFPPATPRATRRGPPRRTSAPAWCGFSP
jgi:hypothetical protein